MGNRNYYLKIHRFKKQPLFFILTFLLTSSFLSSQAVADLVLSAPPRENANEGRELYEPIAEKLSELLGEKVVYQQPKSWAEYANKMRDGYYDIVFDGPHFVAWRQKNLKHTPVASLPGTLEFYIVTSKENKQLNSARDLIGKKICGAPSPHLATDLIYDLFKNPVLQPIIHEVKGGQLNALQEFKDGKCAATIMRSTLFHKLPEEERKNLKVVVKTAQFPNQTISVSQRLQNQADAIANFLVSKDGAITADNLLTRFSGLKKEFIKASPEKFVGAADILEGVVWGW
ncbi:MAG TPA: PhnD/SsuA/transferrin family substrate-binding protein [Gammaproteobacteria bacterium]